MITTFFIGAAIFSCGLGMMRLNEGNKELLRNKREWYTTQMAGVFEIVYTALMIVGGIGMALSLFSWMFSFMFPCGDWGAPT